MKATELLSRFQRDAWTSAFHFTSAKRSLSALMLPGLGMLLAIANPLGAETISSRRLLEVVDLSAPVVSPDGTRVAFRAEQASIERNTYDTTWYVQDMDGSSPPRSIADGGIPLRDSAGVSLPETVLWSPDGRWVYYRARLDDKTDVWRAAVDGSGSEALTRDSADVREFSLSVDGKVLFYSVGATRKSVLDAELNEYDRGIRIDRSVPIAQGLFRSGNVDGRLSSQRFSRQWFEPEQLLADVPEEWKALNLTTRKMSVLDSVDYPKRPLTVSDLAAEFPDLWKLVAAPDDQRIALLVRSGDGAGLLYKPSVELSMLPNRTARRVITCHAELCANRAITNILWRPASDEILFTITPSQEGLAQSVYRWDVRTNAVYPVVRTAGLINGGRDRFSACGISHDALACVAAEADQPPRLERIDLKTGQRQVLFDPNLSLALDMSTAVPARLLRWEDGKGREFTGQFFPARTTNGAAPPLFVTYYTCSGFLRGGVGDEWPLASMAEHGISALCINQAPLRQDAIERYDVGLSAVESAVDLLASQGQIDRTKVGMGGLSFGSEVTLWTAVHSNVLSAASITSPSIEPNYFLFRMLHGDPFRSNLMKIWQLGTPEETPNRWREISPALQTNKITAPILMQMPEQEYLYGLGFAMPLLMENRGDLYVFPHEPHQKFQPRHKWAAYERNLDWFRFWLLGQEDADMTKTEQYAHWQRMKVAVTQRSEVVLRPHYQP